MQTSDGSGVGSKSNPVNPAVDASNASNPSATLTQSQAKFWYVIGCQGYKELVHSLKMVQDLALYYSNVPFDKAESQHFSMSTSLWKDFRRRKDLESRDCEGSSFLFEIQRSDLRQSIPAEVITL